MTDSREQLVSEAASPGDAEAIRHLREAIDGGRHWYLALLEAIGLWSSAGETREDRTYRYLIEGEAFDWLLLAERLCGTVEGRLPEEEKNALLFHGRPPLALSAGEVRSLIGESKYRQYLNFFYGVTVEESLLLAVQGEIDKERQGLGYASRQSYEEAHWRIYNETRAIMLKCFRQEKGYAQLRSITLTEMKEFTYWLFRYRLKHAEKARIASDTKKALDYLKRQWRQKGIYEAMTADGAVPG